MVERDLCVNATTYHLEMYRHYLNVMCHKLNSNPIERVAALNVHANVNKHVKKKIQGK